MEEHVEIHWVGLTELDEAERERADSRFARLGEGHSDLIDLRVVGRGSGHHQHGGQEVRITCQARGREIVAARTATELGLALHDALDAFESEVHKLREKRRDRSRKPPKASELARLSKDEE
jgi:ribosome-associated translation inhibitor RaiA